jgi:monoamine oxidase
LGVPLERASLKWAGWESGFGGSDAAPEGGYQSLVTKVLESSGAEIKTQQHVSGITLLESGHVRVETQSGDKYTARTALCTIPLGVLKAHSPTFNPALPERKLETIARVHVGTLEKLLLSYDQAWWPSSDQVGSMTFLPTSTTSSPPTSIKEVLDQATLVVASFAGPSLPNPQPTLLIYLSATPATALASLKATAEDVANAMHTLISTRLGVSNASKPSKAALTTWGSDIYSCGATTTPNVITEKGQVERTPLDFVELGKAVWAGRLGFAGEHTDPDHRGSVAGAVVSGEREGVRIQRYLGLLDTQAAAKV